MPILPGGPTPPRVPIGVNPAIEAKARELCAEDGYDPDELAGVPLHPRWHDYIQEALAALNA